MSLSAGNRALPSLSFKPFLHLWYQPIPNPNKPNEKWIKCKVTANEAGANCGDGKGNVFYSSEDGVKPGGQLLSDGKTWMVTVRGQAPALGQAWRARVEVPVVLRP